MRAAFTTWLGLAAGETVRWSRRGFGIMPAGLGMLGFALAAALTFGRGVLSFALPPWGEPGGKNSSTRGRGAPVPGDGRGQERPPGPPGKRDRPAAEAANYGMFDWEPGTGRIDWDDDCLDLLGLRHEELAPTFEAFLDRVHPEDRRAVRDALEDHTERGAELSLDYRVWRPGDGYRSFIIRARTLRGPEGTPLRTVGVIGDVTERGALGERPSGPVLHDLLASLPDRATFTEILRDALDRARRNRAGLAVLVLNLGDFETTNSSPGREAGARALATVARRLWDCLRPGDTLARFGDGEFAVLLETVDPEEAASLARRIGRELEKHITVDGRELHPTPSIGIAIDDTATHPAGLLSNADTAMREARREAKHAGKVRFRVHHAGMGDQGASAWMLEHLDLEQDLRRAVEREEFVVHYQPKVSLRTLEVFSFEALVRWNHPRRGLIPPGEFITLAEETGLIEPIGRWVLEQACAQVKTWQERYPGEPPLKVSVNLSPRQFRQPDLFERVAGTLFDTGLDPRCLTLEITENALLEDPPTAIATLKRLRELCVDIAIDDFGTERSSLSRLRLLPVNTLKLDRSFIAGLGGGVDDGALVAGVVGLSNRLGLSVVAEGVETSRQLTHLRTLGCTQAQGFYFAKPLPGREVDPLLEADGAGEWGWARR